MRTSLLRVNFFSQRLQTNLRIILDTTWLPCFCQEHACTLCGAEFFDRQGRSCCSALPYSRTLPLRSFGLDRCSDRCPRPFSWVPRPRAGCPRCRRCTASRFRSISCHFLGGGQTYVAPLLRAWRHSAVDYINRPVLLNRPYN